VYEYLGFPQALSIGIVVGALVLALAGWLSGKVGSLTVPSLPQRARRFLRWAGPVLVVISLLGFVPSSRFGGAGLISPRWVIKVERSQNLSKLPEAPGSNLREIYLSANSTFLAEVRDATTDRPRLFYLCGAAGSGKSFLVNNSGLPDVQIVKLHELENLPRHIDIPDLKSLDGRVTVNQLPGLPQSDPGDVAQLLLSLRHESSPSRLSTVGTLIIDDLDEIHPNTARWLLQGLEASLGGSQASNASVLPRKIVVVGRPEGFAIWLRSEARQAPDGVRSPTELVVPNLFARGTLDMLLSDYRRFKFKDTSPGTDSEKQALHALVGRCPFLRSSLGNLALSNLIMEEALIEANGSPLPSFELRDRLFDGLLERNSETHGRPKSADDAYVQTFEKIAASYSTPAKLDKSGYFFVNFEDTVTVKDNTGMEMTFKTRDVLDRSGLVYLNPADYDM
jgi:hypothetical protein